MFTIESDVLKVSVHTKGAELQSIYNKQQQLEYLWSGDPAFWAKKSPVLFPIVGTLKNDTFFFNNESYNLGRHGFARDMEFTVTEQTPGSITLAVESNEATFLKFPFHFRLEITYTIQQDQLHVLYSVINMGNTGMYFSVGGHPAFKLPLTTDTAYNDYYLEFNAVENAGRWPISNDGLIEQAPIPFFQNANRLPLTKELFYKDALVFKGLRSNEVALKSGKTNHGFSFHFSGFPYLGLWSAKDAGFVCIEPWCGIADSVTTSQQLPDKEGIRALAGKEVFKRTWSVHFW